MGLLWSSVRPRLEAEPDAANRICPSAEHSVPPVAVEARRDRPGRRQKTGGLNTADLAITLHSWAVWPWVSLRRRGALGQEREGARDHAAPL